VIEHSPRRRPQTILLFSVGLLLYGQSRLRSAFPTSRTKNVRDMGHPLVRRGEGSQTVTAFPMFSAPEKKVRIPAVFSATKDELKALKALKAYPTYWWWRRGTGNDRCEAGQDRRRGRRKRPLESAPSTKQLSKIRCASPRAEEATKCYVEDRVMLFRSTLLHLYRYSPRGLVLTNSRSAGTAEHSSQPFSRP
jgi:hypothetical protein